jgi:hypothetical protein
MTKLFQGLRHYVGKNFFNQMSKQVITIGRSAIFQCNCATFFKGHMSLIGILFRTHFKRFTGERL